MKAKIEKYGAELLIVALLLGGTAFAFHFFSPLNVLKNMFGGSPQQSIKVEDTPEYKALHKELEAEKDSTGYWKGVASGYREQLYDDSPGEVIQKNYKQNISKVIKAPKVDTSQYHFYLKRLESELKNENNTDTSAVNHF